MNVLRTGFLTLIFGLIITFGGIFIPHLSKQSEARHFRRNILTFCYTPRFRAENQRTIRVVKFWANILIRFNLGYLGECDADGDGVPDNIDKCANDPDKSEPGQCGCGNPDTDTDADGTADCNDLCPNGIVNPGEQCDPPGERCDSDQDGTNDSTCDDQCQCPTPPVVTGSGLRVDILDATIGPDRRPIVTIKLTDDMGNPLSSEGVRIRLIIARIENGESQYTDYITNQDGQAASEDSSEGTLGDLGDGVFAYTFNTVLPEGYDPNVTHTVGIYADREVSGETFVANSTFDFVPSGVAVTTVRDVVRTDACNNCHDPLALHGGFTRDVRLCVLCHTPQTIDPDTGNTVDFKVMVHKIHMGAQLPSVQAGTPYQIVGFNGTVHDYSTVEFPQDISDCTTCHTTEATQSDAFKNNPTRASCGSCHDDVDFATGANHGGGVQLNDGNCSVCHAPGGVAGDVELVHLPPLPPD